MRCGPSATCRGRPPRFGPGCTQVGAHVSHPDPDLETGRERAARYLAHRFAVEHHAQPGAWNTRPGEQEGRKLSAVPLHLLAQQLGADEILVERARPLEAASIGVRSARKVVSIERVADLQAERVARAEPRRPCSRCCKGVPNAGSVAGRSKSSTPSSPVSRSGKRATGLLRPPPRGSESGRESRPRSALPATRSPPAPAKRSLRSRATVHDLDAVPVRCTRANQAKSFSAFAAFTTVRKPVLAGKPVREEVVEHAPVIAAKKRILSASS